MFGMLQWWNTSKSHSYVSLYRAYRYEAITISGSLAINGCWLPVQPRLVVTHRSNQVMCGVGDTEFLTPDRVNASLLVSQQLLGSVWTQSSRHRVSIVFPPPTISRQGFLFSADKVQVILKGAVTILRSVELTSLVWDWEQSGIVQVQPTTLADTASCLVISQEWGETVVSRVAVREAGGGQEIFSIHRSNKGPTIPPTLLPPPCGQSTEGITLKSVSFLSWLVLLWNIIRSVLEENM